ncbi:helix-turn-helix domain-containing protein, partial [Candidatus Poribacteria bacterium]|nr:helix-turn-helix domain-containing protein [Candidatus Poribacteria bacterium]MYA56687.1 helix-turn-helix domain-containing protein [Candidatus Poribacteria bacterium]
KNLGGAIENWKEKRAGFPRFKKRGCKHSYTTGERFAALERKPQSRPSHPPKLDGSGEARLIALACSDPPKGFARWTLQLLADELVGLEIVESLSIETVRQTLKKTNYARTGGSIG